MAELARYKQSGPEDPETKWSLEELEKDHAGRKDMVSCVTIALRAAWARIEEEHNLALRWHRENMELATANVMMKKRMEKLEKA